MPVKVIGPKDKCDTSYINTTSRSNNWSKGLSPFFLGPIPLYGNREAKNMENAWQFAKVYQGHVDTEGNLLPSYWEWAEAGWANKKAHRYPMPKGIKPLYSLWDGEKLGYVEARKCIYIPLYANAVLKTEAFTHLKQTYEAFGEITLWDFDGYDYLNMGITLKQVANDPNRKMGHAFVLAMLLDGFYDDIISG